MHIGCVCPALQGLVKATYTLPENIISPPAAGTSLGDLIAAHYTLPENTIENVPRGRSMGCGCTAGLGVTRYGMGALGDLSDIWGSITDTVSGFSTTTWIILGGAAVAVVLLTGGRGSTYKPERQRAIVQAVERVKSQHPSYVGRFARAASAF
jgi:hypothetical protein